MKSMTLLLVFASLFLVSPVMADDIYVYGEDLLIACNQAIKHIDATGDADHFQSGRCWGYIAGAADMHELMDHVEEARHTCKPENKDISELARAVLKYLKANPDKLNIPAGILIFDSFHEYFPCGANNPPKK
jgi:hypothetical protein